MQRALQPSDCGGEWACDATMELRCAVCAGTEGMVMLRRMPGMRRPPDVRRDCDTRNVRHYNFEVMQGDHALAALRAPGVREGCVRVHLLFPPRSSSLTLSLSLARALSLPPLSRSRPRRFSRACTRALSLGAVQGTAGCLCQTAAPWQRRGVLPLLLLHLRRASQRVHAVAERLPKGPQPLQRAR